MWWALKRDGKIFDVLWWGTTPPAPYNFHNYQGGTHDFCEVVPVDIVERPKVELPTASPCTRFEVQVLAPMKVIANCSDRRSAEILAERFFSGMCEVYNPPERGGWVEAYFGQNMTATIVSIEPYNPKNSG